MGFTITEAIPVVSLGISLPNVYCTIRGGYNIYKVNNVNVGYDVRQIPADTPPPYMLCGRLVGYAQKPASGQNLVPIFETNINLPLNTWSSEDPILLLYAKAKSFFPNLTLTDC